MDSIEQHGIVIEEDVAKRLAALIGEGRTVSDFANEVLRSFADEMESAVEADTAEDERRLREYERTGEALSQDQFFDFLDRLETRATAKIGGA